MRQSVEVSVTNLNQLRMSDYYFCTVVGTTSQFSRKQAGELLSDIDEAEDQLRNYYDNADRNYQIVEGIISPVPLLVSKKKRSLDNISIRLGKTGGQLMFSYSVTDSGFIFGERDHRVSADGLAAWLHRLDCAGITTYYTINWVHTAKLLVAIYKNEQKPPEEHSTLQRYIKPKIAIKKHEPLVSALMGISLAYGVGIGEKKAEAIARQYCCLMDIASSSTTDIAKCSGIGKNIATKLLEALRLEV